MGTLVLMVGILLVGAIALALENVTFIPVSQPALGKDLSPTRDAVAALETPASRAAGLLASMAVEQKAGQVLMASVPVTGVGQGDQDALAEAPIGNVFLKGRRGQGAEAVGRITQHLTDRLERATRGVRPFVAVDQEGGYVQTLKGPGFSAIPQAIQQAVGPASAREATAKTWGEELRRAGVKMNLAPVLDTVPSPGFVPQNAPIGYFGRHYGYEPAAISRYGVGVDRGFQAQGVAPVVKHFPGLGRVSANTDVSHDVTDTQTTRNDPALKPFADAIRAGIAWIMVSNARYLAIDRQHIGPLSPVIVEHMLRTDLGFKGGIISDDLCDAAALSDVPLRERGSGFLAAGGTMALCTKPGACRTLHAGIVQRAQTDSQFAAKLDAAALRLLEIKGRRGLLSSALL